MNPPEFEPAVFAEPWQADAFALVVHLHERSTFTWGEWAEALSAEIAATGTDDGGRYYEHWLTALERLLSERGLVDNAALETRKDAWARAYRLTPHGKRVTISD